MQRLPGSVRNRKALGVELVRLARERNWTVLIVPDGHRSATGYWYGRLNQTPYYSFTVNAAVEMIRQGKV